MAAEPREALKDKIRELAHLSPEEWDERRGADPIARTINAVFDIIDSEPTLDAARRASDAQVAAIADRLDTFCDACGGRGWIETADSDRFGEPTVNHRQERCMDSIHAAADQVRAQAVPDRPTGQPAR